MSRTLSFRFSALVLPLAFASLPGCSDGAPSSTLPDAVLGVADGISGEAIEAHMRVLAADDMEGRGTGTPGHLAAADYVADAFEALGLEPTGPHGGYFQQVPLLSAQLVPEPCAIDLTRDGRTRQLELDEDFVVAADFHRVQAEVTAPVVFVGYGVHAPEIGHDDYEGLDVEGAIVAMFGGAPASFANEARAFYANGTGKAEQAVRRGAIGLIHLQTPARRKSRDWETIIGYSRLPMMRWMDEGTPRDSFSELVVQAMLAPDIADSLFDGTERTHEEAATAADAGEFVSLPLPVTLRVATAAYQQRLESPNVVARLPGSDRADEYVVLTAHLDHLGVGVPVDGDPIHNGAYDNASGVAILIEVARALAALPEPPGRSFLFVATTGEEKGLLGADYFVEHPPVPPDSVVANVNLDMVMMQRPLEDVIAFGAQHSSLEQPVRTAAESLGLALSPDPFPEEVLFIRSDQYPFVEQGIPSLFLVTGVGGGEGIGQLMEWVSNTYHTPSDDLSQPFDFEAGAKFARLNMLTAWLVAEDPQRPTWNEGDFFGDRFAR